MPSLSPITKEQGKKIAKACIYSFVSTFVAALLASGSALDKKVFFAALVAAINATLVTVKQAFTEG